MANLLANVVSLASYVWKRPHTKPGWHRPRSSQGEYYYYHYCNYCEVQSFSLVTVADNGPCRCYVIFEFSSDTITVMLHPRNKLKSNQHPPTLPGAVCAVGSWDVYNHKSQQNVSSDLSKSYTLLFHACFLIL